MPVYTRGKQRSLSLSHDHVYISPVFQAYAQALYVPTPTAYVYRGGSVVIDGLIHIRSVISQNRNTFSVPFLTCEMKCSRLAQSSMYKCIQLRIGSIEDQHPLPTAACTAVTPSAGSKLSIYLLDLLSSSLNLSRSPLKAAPIILYV